MHLQCHNLERRQIDDLVFMLYTGLHDSSKSASTVGAHIYNFHQSV